MKHLLTLTLSVILLLSATSLSAQRKDVILDSNYDGNALKIDAKTSVPGKASVFILFNNLQNCISSKFQLHVIVGDCTITTLEPVDKNRPVSTGGFTYWTMSGVVNPRINDKVIYRLPYSESKSATVKHLTNFGEKHLGESGMKDWYPYMFELEKGDTVFAMRKGVVVKVSDGASARSDGSRVSYSSSENYIDIEHPDGTIAHYSVLDKNSIMVKEWDDVLPGTPLALAGTYDNQIWQLRVNTYYTTFDKKQTILDVDKIKDVIERHHLEPVFATTEGNIKLTYNKTYTPVMNDEVLTVEMSKREKKKYQQGK